jgi:hypothetical protein
MVENREREEKSPISSHLYLVINDDMSQTNRQREEMVLNRSKADKRTCLAHFGG